MNKLPLVLPPTLGIVAGGGSLPALLIEHCKRTGRDFFIIAFEESFSAEIMAHLPHAIVRMGAVGEALAHLRNAGVQEIVMAGHIKRPSLSSLCPDAAGAALLKKLGFAFFGGDDALLRAITEFFESEKFTVVGVETILGGLLANEGVLGKISPDKQAKADILLGMAAAKNLGALDIGQAVVVENSVVIATETVEGTDALITQHKTKRGVLVKAKKPAQEVRVDLPSIGVQTIENLYKNGYAGVAVEAYASLIIDQAETIKKANEYGIFVVGVKYE
jgi:DUF1009 family protein